MLMPKTTPYIDVVLCLKHKTGSASHLPILTSNIISTKGVPNDIF